MAERFSRMGLRQGQFCDENAYLTRPMDDMLDCVDPWKLDEPTETNLELRAHVMAEIACNPWYFFGEVMRIPVPGGIERVRMTPALHFQIWAFMNSMSIMYAVPRQCGATLGPVGLMGWTYFTLGAGALTCMCPSPEGLSWIRRRIRLVTELVPAWMKPISNPKFTGIYGGGNRDTLVRRCRSITPGALFVDELCFIKHGDMAFPALMATLTASFRSVQRGIINKNFIRQLDNFGFPIMVTVNPTEIHDNPTARATFNTVSNAVKFNPKMYNIDNLSPLRERFIYAPFSHLELGYSNEWLYEIRKRNCLSDDVLRQDYLLQWTEDGKLIKPNPKDYFA